MDYSGILKSAEHYLAEETEQRFIDEVKALIEKKRRKRIVRPLLPRFGIRDGGFTGDYRRRHKPHEPERNKKSNTGLGVLSYKGKTRKSGAGQLKRCHCL